MTSTTLTRDRNYYRMCDNSDLIRAAHDNGDELALALAERLADFADVEHERDTLRDALDEATRLVDHLRDEVQDMLDEIEDLRALVNAQ
jgi:HPt (histidine-containing phosphotransfer) domain-containing protein